MTIMEPSPAERDKAIEHILLNGLSKPQGLWKSLCEMYRALGLRYIFCDMAYATVMSIVMTVGFAVLYPLSPERHTYATLFAVAPVFFILVVIVTETMEKISGLYELKMTCKYTIQQITAFRVLCFSLIGAVFCAFTSLYFSWLLMEENLFRAFSLSFCAMFLCAFLTMFILRRFRWKWNHLSIMLLWTVINLFPAGILGQRWESFLAEIPVALTLLVAAAACTLFLTEIKKLMNIRKKEVSYYAGC